MPVLRIGFFALSMLLRLPFVVAVEPPVAQLRKVPPDYPAQAYRARLTGVIAERYPELLGARNSETPVITVLFNPDGSVVGTNLETLKSSVHELTVSEEQFARFGVAGTQLQYIATGRIPLQATTAIVVFGARDSRELDRALVERYFQDVLTKSPATDGRLWILFDHNGVVVRTGQESLSPVTFPKALEGRYPGIHTAESTLTPVLARDGKPFEDAAHHPLQLECVWLTAESPNP